MKRHLLFKSLLLLCALVVGSSSVWADDILNESFNISGTAEVSSPYNGWSVTRCWGGNGSIRLGASSGDKGQLITPALSSLSGNATLTFEVKRYGTDAGSIGITVSAGSGSVSGDATVASSSISADNWTSKTVTITGGSSTTKIKFLMTNKRMYLRNVRIVAASGGSSDYITVSPTIKKVTSVAGSANFEIATDQTLDANPTQFYTTSTGDVTTSKPEWITNASFAAGTLTLTVAANTGADRTAYFRVEKGSVKSDVITITQSQPVSVSLDFSSNTAWEFPTDKTEGSETYTNSGYSITLEGPSGEGYYFDTSNKNLLLGKSGATLTLPAFGFNVSKIKVYGATGASGTVTFNVFVGDTPVSTAATSSKEDHEFAIAADKQDVGTVYVIKVTNDANMRISKIEVYGNGCEAGLVQSYGWATYIPTANVEYPANTAYIITAASVTSGLTLAEVTSVPANTPILLKGEGAKTATVIASADALSSNQLTISDGTDLGSEEYPYVLAKTDDGGACFKQWTGAMSALNGRVMLVLDKNIATARGIFDLDSETTAIETVKAEKANNEYYNLAGQRVAQPIKGLYIVNGKKVIIK